MDAPTQGAGPATTAVVITKLLPRCLASTQHQLRARAALAGPSAELGQSWCHGPGQGKQHRKKQRWLCLNVKCSDTSLGGETVSWVFL